MSSKVKEIEKEALRLEPRERALLAEHLIGSLDPEEARKRSVYGLRKPNAAIKRTKKAG